MKSQRFNDRLAKTVRVIMEICEEAKPKHQIASDVRTQIFELMIFYAKDLYNVIKP